MTLQMTLLQGNISVNSIESDYRQSETNANICLSEFPIYLQ